MHTSSLLYIKLETSIKEGPWNLLLLSVHGLIYAEGIMRPAEDAVGTTKTFPVSEIFGSSVEV